MHEGPIRTMAGVLIWTEAGRFAAMASFYRDTLGLIPHSSKADFINFDWNGVRLSVGTPETVSEATLAPWGGSTPRISITSPRTTISSISVRSRRRRPSGSSASSPRSAVAQKAEWHPGTPPQPLGPSPSRPDGPAARPALPALGRSPRACLGPAGRPPGRAPPRSPGVAPPDAEAPLGGPGARLLRSEPRLPWRPGWRGRRRTAQ